jgi:hypothetical protein
MVKPTIKRLYRHEKGHIPGKWFYRQESGITGGLPVKLSARWILRGCWA